MALVPVPSPLSNLGPPMPLPALCVRRRCSPLGSITMFASAPLEDTSPDPAGTSIVPPRPNVSVSCARRCGALSAPFDVPSLVRAGAPGPSRRGWARGAARPQPCRRMSCLGFGSIGVLPAPVRSAAFGCVPPLALGTGSARALVASPRLPVRPTLAGSVGVVTRPSPRPRLRCVGCRLPRVPRSAFLVLRAHAAALGSACSVGCGVCFSVRGPSEGPPSCPTRRRAVSSATRENDSPAARAFPVSWERGRSGVPQGLATWLILPVVICLSQRLSHACVSMN